MRDGVLMLTLVGLLAFVLAHPFVGVLLWNWIGFMNPHRMVWGFASTFQWAAVVFVVTVIACILRGELRLPPANMMVLLVVGLMLCFTATSVLAMGEPAEVFAKWDRTNKVLLGLLLTASMLTTRQRIHALLWLMVLSIGYYGVRGGIFALFTGGGHRVFGPPMTMIADNNHLATAMLIALPLMNYLRMQSPHRFVRIGLWVAMGLTLLATVSSYSRGALLALAAVTVVLWWRSQRKLISAAILAVAVSGAIAFMPPEWTDRMNTIQEYQADQSATGRLDLWEISWKLALSRPLVGTGFHGPYTQSVVDTVAPGGAARAVHSIWFELLAEHGFPTFFLWLGMSLAGLWYSARMVALARNRPDLSWGRDLGRMTQVSVVAYMVGGTFLSLSYFDYYWTLLIVVAATHGLVARAAAEGAPRHALAGPDTAMAGAGWRNRGSARPATGGMARPAPAGTGR